MMSGYILGLVDGEDKLKSKEHEIKSVVNDELYTSSLFTAYVLFPVLESTFFLQMVHDFMEISGKFGRTSVITLVLRWRELIQSLTLPNCC